MVAFHEIFWILFILYVGRMNWNGWGEFLVWASCCPRRNYSSDRFPWHLSGLGSTSYVVSLWAGRSSDGPEFGIAHYLWAGPHTYFLNSWEKLYCFYFDTTEIIYIYIYITFVIIAVINENMIMNYITIYWISPNWKKKIIYIYIY